MLSVVMPAYNTARFVRFAARSVLDQDVPGALELVIVNDGSTDATGEIADELARADHRVRVVHTDNHGVSCARNTGLSQVSDDAEFIAFLDSDDAFPPDRLQHDLAVFARQPDVDVVYGLQGLVTSEEEDLTADLASPIPSLRGANMGVATIRRQVLDAVGGFDTTYTHGEDLDFLLRMFELGPVVDHIDAVSLYYRQRAGSACTNDAKLQAGVTRARDAHRQRCQQDPSRQLQADLFECPDFGEKLARSNLAYFERNGLPDYAVVIPAYNAAAFVADAIASVLAQTHKPAQIIVVNDGSTDNTLDVLAGFGDSIEVIDQDNGGAAAATNAGMARVRYDWVALLDADDLWEPDKIVRQMVSLSANRGADIITCHMRSFQNTQSDLSVDDTVSGWTRSTLLMRTHVFAAVGPFTQFANGLGETIDWLGRAKEQGFACAFLDKQLARRRLHPDSLTATRGGQQSDYLDVIKAAIRRRRAREGRSNG